jgi:NADPH2:quinone reductase
VQSFLDQVIHSFNARMRTPLVPSVRGIYADGDTVITLFDAAATAADGLPCRNTYTWYFVMRALVLDQIDAAFREVTLERPVPQAGEVLVRIRASGVNPLDLKIRSGQAAHARHPFPAILGLDVAGIVEEPGPGVSQFKPGDAVYGLTGGVGGVQGSLAEFAAVDAQLLAKVAQGISLREAAALPLVFITAWEGLVDRAAVQARQKVLIQGAGGVGHIAIQIARAFGAEVFATGSAGRHKEIERLGATAIDYHRSSVEEYVNDHTAGEGFDLVYDTVGGATLDACFQAVRRFGHVVSCLGWGTHALAPLSFRAGTYSGVFTLLPLLTGEGRAHHGDLMREATRLVETGQLRAQLDAEHFDFSLIEAAYQRVGQGHGGGKVVIDVGT